MTRLARLRTLKHSVLVLVVLLATMGATLLMSGCSPRTAEHPAPSPPADTLANGLPVVLVPKLASWVNCWRRAAPGFAPESLMHGEPQPFTVSYRWADGRGVNGGIRARALVDVLSPDSAYSLDYDMYVDFMRDGDGKVDVSGDVDSAPVLADFAKDSLWQIAFCGTPCFFDGAYWVDARRFVLTGAMESGPYDDGTWRGFLDIYDLSTRLVTGWVSGLVDREQLRRYVSATDSALVQRVERAGLGSREDPATASRVLASPR